MAEIRELSEKDQNEEEKILSISGGYRQPTKPHMKFEYPDPEIQEDLYQLMKYACGEVCTPEQHDKVMKIWTTFIEPLFSISSRQETANDDSAKRLADIEGSTTPLGEVASDNSRSLDISKKGGENTPTEKSRCNNSLIGNGNCGVENGCSPSVDNAAPKQATPIATGEKNTKQENGEDLQKVFNIAFSNNVSTFITSFS